MKNFKLIFVVGIFLVVLCSYVSFADRCPQYYPAPNFDLKKLKGVWYELVEKKIAGYPDVCTTVMINTFDNGTVTLNVSRNTSFGFLNFLHLTPDFTNSYFLEKDDMGYLTANAQIEDQTTDGPITRNVTINSAVIYAKDSLIVLFACIEVRTLNGIAPQWSFNMFTSDEKFDSLSEFYQATTILMDIGVNFDEFEIIYNGPGCKN